MILAQSVDFSPRKLGGPTRATSPNAPRLKPIKRQTPQQAYLAEAEAQRDRARAEHLASPNDVFLHRVYLANEQCVADARAAMGEAGRGR